MALARHFELANTTFRRNFPAVATELTLLRSQPSPPADLTGVSSFEQLKRDNDRLRTSNHELAEHLDLAVANIQRLTLDNHRLHRALETATTITRIDTKIGTT